MLHCKNYSTVSRHSSLVGQNGEFLHEDLDETLRSEVSKLVGESVCYAHRSKFKLSRPCQNCYAVCTFYNPFYLWKPSYSYVTGRPCHGFRRLVACLSPLSPGSRPCEICGEESDIGTDISPRSSVSPFQYHSTVTLHTHILWWMNNMPVRGRSSEIQSHPIDMNINIRMLLDKRFI
jgi:hypothetical protein